MNRHTLIRIASTLPVGHTLRRAVLQCLATEEGESEDEPKSKKKGPPPGWDNFVKEKYGGPSKMVPNPNPKSKKKYPNVTLSTALKDKATMARVMREYAQWREKQQGDEDKKSEKPPEKGFVANLPKNKDGYLLNEDAWNAFGESYNPQRSTWTPEQRSAARSYTGHSYHSINSYLRGGTTRGAHESDMEIIEQLDSLLKDSVLKEPMMVARGLSNRSEIHRLLEENKLEVGTEIEDAGFVSTSIKPWGEHEWDADVELNMKVPKGAKALYLGPPPDDFSKWPEEYELLLNRGTKMRVTRIDKESFPPIIDVEVIL